VNEGAKFSKTIKAILNKSTLSQIAIVLLFYLYLFS